MGYVDTRKSKVRIGNFDVMTGVLPADAALQETPAASYADLAPDAFMTRWLVCGPFPAFEGQGSPQSETDLRPAFDRDFLAQHGGEAGVEPNPALVHETAQGRRQWQFVSAAGGVLDLAEPCGQKDFAVAYAWAEIDLPAPTKGLLGIGSDDAVKLWLNGQLIHENWTFRALSKDQDVVSVSFRKGKNRLLAKVLNGTHTWQFSCRLLGPEGTKNALLSAASQGKTDIVKSLLADRVDVNARDSRGHTPLHKAAYAGSKEIVELLLSNAVDVNARTPDGQTPLHLTRRAGHRQIGALLLAGGADPNLQPSDTSTQVDALFTTSRRGDVPGAAVAVIQDGKVVHRKGYGLSNLEHGIPCTTQTKFRIVSLTKAFTAMAVMMLHEQGLLHLDDPMVKYLPDYPHGEKITIRQLLTHTSGVQEPVLAPEASDQLVRSCTPLEKRYAMCRDEPLEFDPGQRWSYSNAGYIVLGYLIEKVSGRSYETFLTENIFKPLGMNSTGYDHHDTILKHRATGYSREGDTYKNAMYFDMSLFGPSGALYSTIEDMVLWDQALYGGKLIRTELLQQAFTPARLNDGTTIDHYGFGWVLGRNRGLDEIRATGMMPGFESQIVRIPSRRFSVIILSNCTELGVLTLAHEIAEIYLWPIMEPREPAANPS
jgi:CubicO group peptidase (beta-lactamase class C family)